MRIRLTTRARLVLAALLASAALVSGLQVSQVESNMQRVNESFEADQTPR